MHIHLRERDWRMAYALAEVDSLMGEEAERLAQAAATIRVTATMVEANRRELRGISDALATVDDMVQETLTRIVEGRHGIAQIIARPDLGMGALNRALRMDFANLFVTDLERPFEWSLEKVTDSYGEAALQRGHLPAAKEGDLPSPRPGTHRATELDDGDTLVALAEADYSSETLRVVLPALWNLYQGERSTGRRRSGEASADARRATINRAAGNTLAACVADAQVAWQQAPLTMQQRQCLFLAVGLDWSDQEVADFLDISDRTVRRHVGAGLSAMCAYLNGQAEVVRVDFGEAGERLAA